MNRVKKDASGPSIYTATAWPPVEPKFCVTEITVHGVTNIPWETTPKTNTLWLTRFGGEVSRQKAHKIMCDKSLIAVVKKRQLEKRQIHGGVSKHIEILDPSNCVRTLHICSFQTVSSTPPLKRRARAKVKGGPKYIFGTNSQATLSLIRLNVNAKSKSRQSQHNKNEVTTFRALPRTPLPRGTNAFTQAVNHSPGIVRRSRTGVTGARVTVCRSKGSKKNANVITDTVEENARTKSRATVTTAARKGSCTGERVRVSVSHLQAAKKGSNMIADTVSGNARTVARTVARKLHTTFRAEQVGGGLAGLVVCACQLCYAWYTYVFSIFNETHMSVFKNIWQETLSHTLRISGTHVTWTAVSSVSSV